MKDDRIAQERIQTLRDLLVSDPDDPDLYLLLGKALLDRKAWEESAGLLEEAARRTPELAAIRRFWGQALLGAGRPDEARAVWIDGIALAQKTGDLQAGKEMQAFVDRLDHRPHGA